MINLIDNNAESKAAIEAFISNIEENREVLFTTSGTTGAPKKITHSVDTVTKQVKVADKSAIWGLTYEHTKIAASQVIVQAYRNDNTLINLYGKSTKEVHNLIEEYQITHLSGTPTFYRLNFRDEIFNSLQQVTLGGEVVTEEVITLVKKVFPNAKVSNIYALTEYGSLLASSSHRFRLSERTEKYIKLDKTLHVFFDGEWNDTGDAVEVFDDGTFSIVGRESSMINVGGQKVNPYIIEEYLNNVDGIISSKVYAKVNSLTGNLVAADIVTNGRVDIKLLKKKLRETFKPYEVPRFINEVEELNINSTGKISRVDE